MRLNAYLISIQHMCEKNYVIDYCMMMNVMYFFHERVSKSLIFRIKNIIIFQ